MKNLEIERIRNIFRFSICICGDSSVLKSSPDYIMEKYDKFIGLELKNGLIDYDLLNSFKITEYKERWGCESDNIKNILKFLFNFEFLLEIRNRFNFHVLVSIVDVIEIFEKYIGPIGKITHKTYGLHPSMEELVITLVNLESVGIEVIRDIKIKDLYAN